MESAGLVGRGAELASAGQVAREAHSGRPRLLLVSGEPGIGKTALARELSRGARTVWGTCWEGDGVPGFWPWRQIAEQLSGAFAGEAGSGDPGAARFRLFEATATLLREQAAAAPLTVVLDDLQWADPGSLRLLDFLARHLRDAQLLIIGTFRDLEAGLELKALLADLPGAASVITLSGLDTQAVARLLGPDRAGEAEQVRGRTGGNPFFVTQIAGMSGGGSIPGAVGEAVRRRYAALPESAVDLLRLASLVGGQFDPVTLARLAGRAPAEVVAGLAPAVTSRVVMTSGFGYRFEHDLFREVIGADLAGTERAEAHLRLARIRETAAEPPLAEIAANYAAALQGGAQGVDAGAVVAALRAAAGAARAALAFEEAARQLAQADQISRWYLGSSLGELRLELAQARYRAGEIAAARQGFLELSTSDSDPELVAAGAVGVHQAGTTSGDSHAVTIGLLERAEALLPAGSPTRARLLAALARELTDGPERDQARAEALAAQAVELAERQGDQAGLAFCLFAQHDVIWGPGTAGQRLELAARMSAAALAGGDRELHFEARFCRFVALVELADPQLRTQLDELARLAGQTRHPRHRYLVESRRATLVLIDGEQERGLALADAAAELGVMIGEPDAWGVQVTQHFTELSATRGFGTLPGLRERFGPRIAPEAFAPEEGSAELLARGEAGAAAELISAAPPLPDRPLLRWQLLSAAAFDVMVAAQCDAQQVCRASYAELAPYADEMVVIGGAVSVLGPVAHFLGLAARALGQADRAAEHFRQAERVALRCGATGLAARSRAQLESAQATPLLRRDGEFWTVGYAGHTATLKDAKGLHDLAELLANPGRAISAQRLVSGVDLPELGADEVLDPQAREAYRRKLASLEADLAEAEADGDLGRAQRAADEREALVSALASAYGLGGRVRRLGDPGERSRTTVTARIRDALRRIDQVHPELGAHLRATVTTGRECCYRPDAGAHSL